MILSKISRRLKLSILALFNPQRAIEFINPRQLSILNELGQGLSIKNKIPVDKNNYPIPWFTYPTIEYLNQLNMGHCSILEWGCGNSTLYFAARCQEIVSIEHNKSWFNKTKNKLPENSLVIFSEKSEYVTKPISLGRKFDIIIIDGIERHGCVEAALGLLNVGGLIIFDNSERHPDSCLVFRENGFTQIDFHGFGPINKYTWTTSIFFKEILGIKPISNQPLVPVGGGY